MVLSGCSPTAHAPGEGSGEISGILSYPSEQFPPEMQVCAISTKNYTTIICTKDFEETSNPQYSRGYSMTLPSGEYLVYAEANNTTGFFSEFVPCGMDVNACTSHKPNVIEVKDGEKLVNVNPQDWYYKSVYNEAFILNTSGEFIVENSDEYSRIQNYTPDNDLYTLKDGEFFIEIFKGISEEDFGSGYKTILVSEFNGKDVVKGEDRELGGEAVDGIGYYLAGDNILINLSYETTTGLENAENVLSNILWK